MKKPILSFAFLMLLVSNAQARDTILTSSNPYGSPLIMSANSTSGPLTVGVVSNNFPNDVMAGWYLTLQIVPEANATGTLTFQNPATGTPNNPPNYIFSNSPGTISVTNLGNQLSANDFDNNFGTTVPGSPGANLLAINFLASSSAQGMFDLVALPSNQNPSQSFFSTGWTDSNFNTQNFSNVPNGTNPVLIGSINVMPEGGPQQTPEPSSFALMAMVSATMAAWGWCKRKPLATSIAQGS
ncbi:MAG TPA: hypothetical protein VGP68_12505 [Gemmataceae bacterium]|jgi:hypothetical protein|nr:hypothetical protein [Gemmataceae bacterium]